MWGPWRLLAKPGARDRREGNAAAYCLLHRWPRQNCKGNGPCGGAGHRTCTLGMARSVGRMLWHGQERRRARESRDQSHGARPRQPRWPNLFALFSSSAFPSILPPLFVPFVRAKARGQAPRPVVKAKEAKETTWGRRTGRKVRRWGLGCSNGSGWTDWTCPIRGPTAHRDRPPGGSIQRGGTTVTNFQ